jgi:hypothetical protein
MFLWSRAREAFDAGRPVGLYWALCVCAGARSSLL